MSEEQLEQLKEIASLLIEARDKLEKHDLLRTLDEAALHEAISRAHALCSRIQHDATFPKTRAAGTR